MADEKNDSKPARKKASGPVAKKDHVLHQCQADEKGKVVGDWKFNIVKGEPIPDGIPDHLMVALKTEGVVD